MLIVYLGGDPRKPGDDAIWHQKPGASNSCEGVVGGQVSMAGDSMFCIVPDLPMLGSKESEWGQKVPVSCYPVFAMGGESACG